MGKDLKTRFGKFLTATASMTMLSALCVGISSASTAHQKTLQRAVAEELSVYNAIKVFALKAQQLNSSSSPAQFEAVVAPFGPVFQNYRTKVLSQTWASSATRDVRVVASASSDLVSDVAHSKALASPVKASEWTTNFNSNLTQWVHDVNAVNVGLGLSAFTTNGTAVAQCQRAGAIVSTAAAAFHAQFPHVIPSKAALMGTKYGGPYLKQWPTSNSFTFELSSSGQVKVSAPTPVTFVLYKGPEGCDAAGV